MINRNSSSPQSTPEGNTVSIYDAETSFQVIEDAILGLWKVVNNLTTITPPKCDRYRVTIFGSARLKPEPDVYLGVRNIARELTAKGCDIVTGGGPGLMQAANEGSVIADPADQTKSIGIRVDLDFEQRANPFVEQVYQHQTFFTRLHHFVLLSNAFVVVPGGIGTALEALMIWQLLQVRQLHDKPLIMVGHMWSDFRKWAQEYMVNTENPMASAADMEIPHCVDTFAEAIALLREYQGKWMEGCEI